MAGSAFSSGDAEEVTPSEEEYASGALMLQLSAAEKRLDLVAVALSNLADAIRALQIVEHELSGLQLSPDDAYLSCEWMACSMDGEARLMYTI